MAFNKLKLPTPIFVVVYNFSQLLGDGATLDGCNDCHRIISSAMLNYVLFRTSWSTTGCVEFESEVEIEMKFKLKLQLQVEVFGAFIELELMPLNMVTSI